MASPDDTASDSLGHLSSTKGVFPTETRQNPRDISFPAKLTRRYPRIACPRINDVYSIAHRHLKDWYMPEKIWEALPSDIQAAVTGVQYSGAAVVTTLERMDKMKQELGDQIIERDTDDMNDAYTPSIATVPALSPDNISGTSSPATSTELPSTPVTIDQATSDPKPVSCTAPPPPSAIHLASAKLQRYSVLPFQTCPPMNPRVAQWRAEVSHLQEGLVRLRHALRKVEVVWTGVLREYAAVRQTRCASFSDDGVAGAVECWIQAQKGKLVALQAQSHVFGRVVLGWGVA